VGPSLDELASSAQQQGGKPEAYVEQAIVEPDAVVVQGFSAGTMPGNYGEQLDEEQVKALVEYLLNPEASG
jgi:mono/diheme cytochrome c family protein